MQVSIIELPTFPPKWYFISSTWSTASLQKGLLWHGSPYSCLTIVFLAPLRARNKYFPFFSMLCRAMGPILENDMLFKVARVTYKLGKWKQYTWLPDSLSSRQQIIEISRTRESPYEFLKHPYEGPCPRELHTRHPIFWDKVNFYCIKVLSFEITSVFVITFQWFNWLLSFCGT